MRFALVGLFIAILVFERLRGLTGHNRGLVREEDETAAREILAPHKEHA